MEHLTNTYNNGISDLEERGYFASTKYYEALSKVEKDNIAIRQNELEDLIWQMSEGINSGSIAEGSEAWYKFQQSINEVKEAIQESETALVEFNNEARQLKWDMFDYLQELISNVTSEADFLINLLEDNDDLYDDKGQFTDQAWAAAGLHGQNYNTYMNQADRYAEELLDINKQIAEDPYNKTLLERREELLEAQREAILAANDEKQAIVDLVEEGINLELDALQEVIDKYEEALDTQKDVYDYQKDVKKQAEEIAALQKRLAAYSGDNSEEAKATRQQLEVELSDAMEDLQETEYERYISEQKKILDELYNEYELILNARLDNIDALISDMITAVNGSAETISETIKTQATSVGYTISENQKAIWSNEGSASGIITKYGEAFTSALTTVNDVISKIAIKIGAMKSAADIAAEEAAKKAAATTPTNTSVKPQTTTNSATNTQTTASRFNEDTKRGIAAAIWIYGGSRSGWGDDPERRQKLTAKFGASNAAAVQSYINAHANNGDLYRYWVSTGRNNLSQYYYSAFKKGGLADYTGMAWLDGTPSDPEMVLNPNDTKNFIALKDAMQSVADGSSPLAALFGNGSGYSALISELASVATPSEPQHNTSIGNVSYQITIPIDHVQDYEDFMNKMRTDTKFEQLIQTMTIGRVSGETKLSKNKYKW